MIQNIASEFNKQNGRSILWKEAMNLTFDGNIMTDIDDWFTRAAELYKESSVQFERMKVIEFVKSRIAESFRCLENGVWEHHPFDSHTREGLMGMKDGYSDVLKELQSSLKSHPLDTNEK